MPGAFAHITLVNMLKETRRLDALGGFPDAAKAAASLKNGKSEVVWKQSGTD